MRLEKSVLWGLNIHGHNHRNEEILNIQSTLLMAYHERRRQVKIRKYDSHEQLENLLSYKISWHLEKHQSQRSHEIKSSTFPLRS